jgi:hypothetical protein
VRISKKTREQAALWCSVMASNKHHYTSAPTATARESLDINDEAAQLAFSAFWFAIGRRFFNWTTSEGMLANAEAESMLRTGWTP